MRPSTLVALRQLTIALLLTTLSLGGATAGESQSVAFTKADVAVLKRAALVKKASDTGVQLLLTAPVRQMLSSSNPVGVLITISTTAWEGMTRAAKGFQKIAACTIRDLVLEHLAIPDEPISGSARRYFDRIETINDERCSG
jgi:hypothetical protein